ncbi:MAG: acyl-CoA dehydrogenase [Pyrinomonadaceae bacterium]|nr:acyl-CoA dehydrogenase [Pyrinomonadaceae bacterium]
MKHAYAPAQQSLAESLEQHLGDPLNTAHVFSFKQAVELDEAETYPEEACRLLEAWGLQDYYVPVECGGRQASLDQLVQLVKVVARRDFTVAVTHVTSYLGAVTTWLAGTTAQRDRLREIIGSGARVALALTERGHGSDILSTEVEAVKVEGGYLLSGEKWLINNATRSAAMTVFARTKPQGGPRGFSLFLVEKGLLDPASFTCLPKIKTHGLRGAEIGGIEFHGAFISDQALIGAEGTGLELMLKGFQLTRIIVPALSLGAADTALRTTMNFALSRRLYGSSIFSIPHTRKVLVDAFIDLLIGDCVAMSAARAVAAAPEQLSVWSAVAKYYVPTLVEEVMKNLSVLLGARHYLREGHDWGIFQKMLRDQAIASVFDGSTIINLNSIAQQLKQLADRRQGDRNNPAGASAETRARLETIFSLVQPLPGLAAERLELANRGNDDILKGLEIAAQKLGQITVAGPIDRALLENIRSLVNELINAVGDMDQRLAKIENRAGSPFNQSPELFDLAKLHCQLHAAAACVLMWIYNRDSFSTFISEGSWLVLCLDRILRGVVPQHQPLSDSYREDATGELLRLYQDGRLFSIVPLQLA